MLHGFNLVCEFLMHSRQFNGKKTMEFPLEIKTKFNKTSVQLRK